MAKDFSKYNDDNPVMAILAKAKKEEAEQSNSMAILQNIAKEEAPVEKRQTPITTATPEPVSAPVQAEVKPAEYAANPVETVIEAEPEEAPKVEEIKKILMNISIRETTKKEWKMFFLEHDLSMTQGIETAVEYLMSEVKKNNIKLSKGGITK
ncbi:MAG: hypothetical protein KIG83_11670 [Treponema sp.]|nr:hypothetical protein [Treponema sp.]